MSAIITSEHPDAPDAIRLITELEARLKLLYPPQSRHGFSVDQLLAEAVAFFLLRENGIPAGCSGIKFMGREYGRGTAAGQSPVSGRGTVTSFSDIETGIIPGSPGSAHPRVYPRVRNRQHTHHDASAYRAAGITG